MITSISSFSLKDPNNLANVLASTLNAASGNNVYQNFTLTNWCSVYNGGGSCPEQSYTSSIIISSGFKNPALAIFPSHSIIIEIYTSTGFVIDAISCDPGQRAIADNHLRLRVQVGLAITLPSPNNSIGYFERRRCAHGRNQYPWRSG